MKRRYIYSILFGVPGLAVAALISAVLLGMGMGVLWIFVFGDNPWPAWVESVLPALLTLTFVVVWLGSVTAGYLIGKRFEGDPTLNKKHVLLSAGVTLACVLFVVVYQLGAGNLGPKSDGTLCSDYCSQQGFAASSMPPRDSGGRSCSCLDSTGHAIITVPIDSIQPVK